VYQRSKRGKYKNRKVKKKANKKKQAKDTDQIKSAKLTDHWLCAESCIGYTGSMKL